MQQPDPALERTADAFVAALYSRLNADERVATPYDVIRTIDSAIARLQALRDKAHREHERRTDAALSRSGQLVAGDVDAEVTR